MVNLYLSVKSIKAASNEAVKDWCGCYASDDWTRRKNFYADLDALGVDRVAIEHAERLAELNGVRFWKFGDIERVEE